MQPQTYTFDFLPSLTSITATELTAHQIPAFRAISFERRAFRVENLVRSFLGIDPGSAILEKLQVRDYLSETDIQAVNSFVLQKLTEGELRAGLYFVNRDLVYVRLAD